MASAEFEFFLELGDYCHRNHPPDVWINASSLARGVVGPTSRANARSVLERVYRAGGMPLLFARAAYHHLRRGLDGVPMAPMRVLIALPFARHDYVQLVRPVARSLAEDGTRCAVLTSDRGTTLWVGADGADGAGDPRVVAFESAATVDRWHAARRIHAGLLRHVADVARRFGLRGRQARELAAYFAGFAFDKAIAAHVLERLEPDLVLGLHFNQRRGWQAAVRELADRGSKVPVTLLQHGAFAADEEFHDFEGADVALLWGERWRRELCAFPKAPHYPTPVAEVTGNPKYDATSAAAAPPDDGAGRTSAGGSPSPHHGRRVLYLSGHDAGRTLEEPLRWLLAAAGRDNRLDLAVKPHPAESPTSLRAVLRHGAPEATVLDPHVSLHAALLGRDTVVGPPSSALFEAARLGRPVVLLAAAPNRVYDGFTTVADATSLGEVLARLHRDPAYLRELLAGQRALLDDTFGPLGGATDVVSAAIARRLPRAAPPTGPRV